MATKTRKITKDLKGGKTLPQIKNSLKAVEDFVSVVEAAKIPDIDEARKSAPTIDRLMKLGERIAKINV